MEINMKSYNLESFKKKDIYTWKEIISVIENLESEIYEKNEIIKKDSRYGRIVCRCESVTEGEIVETLHMEPKPKTLDALKRRTRCGMGRCQGGFCTPVVTEIMARELGVSELAITKSGGASHLLLERTKA